jgi:hypothetical protein
MTQNKRDLRAFLALSQALAIEDAEQMPTTPEIEKQAHEITELARDRAAHRRREARARQPSNIKRGAIRAAIRAMSPAQVLAQLIDLRAQHPEMAFAHRDFDHISENDLRSALEDAESLVERGN